MERYVCIHGHFYQPPRENPWLEAIELQDSAYPFHDWNERITSECYAPNAYARLLNGDGRIDDIVNNYSRISFNFGPTLLSSLEDTAPEVYQAILQADIQSRQRFSGHGSAIAQCYNHMIMPLANRRDKYTQVFWGIRDFEQRFGRRPEGMWLPECGADNESLDVLAEQGIKFTILSPFQASRIRSLQGGRWHDVNGGRIDPTQPYLVKLPSKRTIAVFVYDGPVSRGVAFEQLLTNGERFARRLTDIFDPNSTRNQLVHIATDGESYGHHFKHGEMALAYALNFIEINQIAKLTNYAEYLDRHPPTEQVEIHQGSAWSCSHGVERWNSNCGCNSGGRPGWNQEWRLPLRSALDWLRDKLAPLYEERGREFLKDPWAARDEYVDVILDRSQKSIGAFFERHAARQFSEADRITALRLLELQRHAMLMYTSCGWFFDELSGMETVQVIQYAARAIQLSNDLLATNVETGFLEMLDRARSNIREFGTGKNIYDRFVRPAVMDREKVGAHYAVSSLFESYPEHARIYSYSVRQEDRQLFTAGRARLAIGRIQVVFEVTLNSDVISYAVLHQGEHHLNCGVRHFEGDESYAAMQSELRETFYTGDFAALIRAMDRHFGESHYSLRNLFRDEQRKILDQILEDVNRDVRHTYKILTDRYTPLLRFLANIHSPAPKSLQFAFETVLNSDLLRQLESERMDAEQVRCLFQEAAHERVPLDHAQLAYRMKRYLDRLSSRLFEFPEDHECLETLTRASELLPSLPFETNLWKPQNTWHRLKGDKLPDLKRRSAQGDPSAVHWVDRFSTLGEHLGFRVDSNGS